MSTSPKYRVTMTATPSAGVTFTAVDYVPQDMLDAYTADARTRWPSVVVSSTIDYGPGGIDAPTAVLPNLIP